MCSLRTYMGHTARAEAIGAKKTRYPTRLPRMARELSIGRQIHRWKRTFSLQKALFMNRISESSLFYCCCTAVKSFFIELVWEAGNPFSTERATNRAIRCVHR
jgi:hypothetical protein